MASYATERKIRIIKEQCGESWEQQFPNRSIDSVYNEITGDNRKTLFCKLNADSKDKLDQMLIMYEVEIGTLMEQWIDEHYKDYSKREQTVVSGLATEYS